MDMVYRTDPRMRYATEELWFAASLYVLSWEEDFHQLMLNDHVRMEAYRRAIRKVVRPGMAVADVGTGTGILALWALEAGARVVHGIDVNERILRQAEQRMAAAGLSSRFQAFHALAHQVTLPERVDVVLSEILGNLADNEGMTPILADARARFLKQGGQMLPRRARSFLVPVAAVQAHAHLERRRCRGLSERYDLDDLLARLQVRGPFDLYYDAIIPTRTHLAQPQEAAHFALDGTDPDRYHRDLVFTAQQEGLFTGFKGYFTAELAEGVVLDISGDDIAGRLTSDSWKHCYLPIEQPIPVHPGDQIAVTYAIPPGSETPFRPCYSWSGTVRRGARPLGEFHSRTG
jgi:protein arginine N-methyltransferase 1